MDIEGIDVAVMYGTRGRQILCHDDLAPDYAAALARAYNWAADYCKADPRRLKFAAQIAMHDVKSAVAEVRRCVDELGAIAVIGTPNPVNGQHLHDEVCEPCGTSSKTSTCRSAFIRPARPRSGRCRLSCLDLGSFIMGGDVFDLDRFIEDCCGVVREDPSHKAAREVLARANSDPAAILTALGEPTRAGVTALYKSDTLTILNVVWGKRMTIMPHDHRMWAVIGVYTGREDNIFWRRVAGDARGLIEAAGAKSLGERCAEPLGRDVIHSVTNPLGRLTAAIHVYGGDFYGAKRSDWDPENLLERDCDFALHRQIFEEANAA